MSNQTVYDWLEWAQDKYDAAQERFAYGGRSMETMNQYSTLVSALEDAIAYRRGGKSADERAFGKAGESLRRICENMRLNADSRPGSSTVSAWADELERLAREVC